MQLIFGGFSIPSKKVSTLAMNKTIPLKDRAAPLVAVSKFFHSRGWSLGTSGNFSIVTNTHPLRLAITPSGIHKDELTLEQMVEIDDQGNKISVQPETPSEESLIHVSIIKAREAEVVLHVHSIWDTLLSELHARQDGFPIEGYEMLKGLSGIKSHQHREWIPILENSQNMEELAIKVDLVLRTKEGVHGFLLRRHGLYTWGKDLQEAKRHVEVLEFLFEVAARKGAV